MAGQWINVDAADGSGSFRAYLAVPPAGKGPGLVLAQEIFGVNSTMQEAADSYAAEGYTVLVPDLFWRQEPGVELGYTEADWQRAFGYYKGFDEAKGVEDIQAALDALRKRPETLPGKTGALGYCLGGKLAYLAGCRTDVDLAVGYYGVGIESALGEAEKIRGKLVLHIAEKDQFCPPESQAAIKKALAGRERIDVFSYPGVDHAFARVGGDHFDEAAATLANQRTRDALRAAIGPQ